jgi:beta-glucosidase
MKNLCLLFLIVLFTLNLIAQPKYKDSSFPIEERVEDLVKRMILEEKVGQLFSFWSRDTLDFDQDGNYIGVRDTVIINRGVGSMASRGLWFRPSSRQRAQCANGIQKYMVEKTRLGIPVLMFGEALHGFMADGASSFPQAIALGSSWDTTLVERIFTVAAREARAMGIRQVLSPVLDLALDPRWGRTEECYSEDPYLASRLGMAAVFGFQGRGKTMDKEHVVVTLKHFAGHGQSEGGRNIAPLNHSERYFRETHLYPFEMAINRANAWSVMASYNEWDGVPNHVNHKLLTDILRGEWGFNGFVMSDGGGLDVTYRHHLAAGDSAESGVLSVKAGIDFDLGSRKRCFMPLVDQVKQGNVSEKVIDRAVKNVLRVKFSCGLFENPYIDIDKFEKIANCDEHKTLALQAAYKAMVLLKNENSTLPLDATRIKTLAVIGPNAADIHLGGYSAVPMKGISVLYGIREFAKDRFKVVYAEGCKLTLNKECHWRVNENPILNDPEDDRQLIKKAVKIAKKSDAIVLVLGENELINREAWSENHLGDRDDLGLVGRQNELAKAILATGKPLVIVLINGRPLTINYLAQNAPAIIECWYLGQETGYAVADVIFGKVNPSGKLPVTFPRSVGQLPCFYNKKPSRFREYVLAESTPLYPFGFGLSYTTFDYNNLTIEPKEISPDGTAEVSVDVTNTGKMKGDEIVQFYIHDLVSLPTRPVKELKDFTRITLNPGETQKVTFTITKEKLEALDLDMKRVVQSGDFEIMVGKSSVDVLVDTIKVK